MKTILFVLVTMTSFYCEAQIRAVTAEGEEVILNNDGTWKYVSFVEKVAPEIKTNTQNFVKPLNARDLVISEVSTTRIYFDAKKWKIKKSKTNKYAEFEIESLKFKDLFGVLFTEKTEPDIILLTKHILDDCQKQSKDSINILKQEFRIVNNFKVIFVKHELKLKKQFTYWRYFFSNEYGCGQFSLATAKEVTPEKEYEIEELLNGIIMIEK
jgi:hypothetical protein